MLKKAKLKKHVEYYIAFISIQMFGLLLVLMNSQNRSTEIFLIVLMASIYATWSIIHQYIHHHLTTKIVVEYILVGILGVTVSLFIFT